MDSERTRDSYHGRNRMKDHGVSGGIYGLGFIGAAIYFLQHAPSVLAAIIGLIKAVFWPALIIYKVLELLNM